MTPPFGTRLVNAFVCGQRELATRLGVTLPELKNLLGRFQGGLAETDSDPFWHDLDTYLSMKIAELEGLRQELANKAEAERKRRLTRRLETMR